MCTVVKMTFADFFEQKSNADDADLEDVEEIRPFINDNFPPSAGADVSEYYAFLSCAKSKWGAYCGLETADPTQVCLIGLRSLFASSKKLERSWQP